MKETENRYKIRVGNRELDLTTPRVMAIINVTPDSFWSGSRNISDSELVQTIERAVTEGASILDVGGYSSRPGAEDVTVEQERERVLRAVKLIRESCPKMVVSIDTFRSQVVREVVKRYGECVVNDISAGELDPNMIPLVGELGVPYIAMHMRGGPQTMQKQTDYKREIVEEVKIYFASKIEELQRAGVEQIIIDPGFGFAKTTQQNYQLLNGMDELMEFGYPLLSGVSRKSMIYKVLETTPEQSLAGTCALNWESLQKGASVLRVHDTREAVDVVGLFNYYKGSVSRQ